MICPLRMVFYAVRSGKIPGIYTTWDQCNSQVHGFSGARFKKFNLREQAERFLAGDVISDSAAPSGDRAKFSSVRAAPYPRAASVATRALRRSHVSSDKRDTADNHAQHVTPASPHDDDDNVEWPDDGLCDGELAAITGGDNYATLVENHRISSEVPQRVTGNPKYQENAAGLLVDSKGYLHVWTDGACSANGAGAHRARAGIGVFFGVAHALNVSAPVDGAATNNNAEIQAAWHALELATAAGHERVCVHTDSQFVINCATRWLSRWARNGWTLSNGGAVKNRRQLECLQRAMNDLTVKWVYVRGHSGDEGNEHADKLACAGALKYQPPA